jgi:hypothetical protein
MKNIWISDRFSLDKKGFMRLDKRIIPSKETLEILERYRNKDL